MTKTKYVIGVVGLMVLEALAINGYYSKKIQAIKEVNDAKQAYFAPCKAVQTKTPAELEAIQKNKSRLEALTEMNKVTNLFDDKKLAQINQIYKDTDYYGYNVELMKKKDGTYSIKKIDTCSLPNYAGKINSEENLDGFITYQETGGLFFKQLPELKHYAKEYQEGKLGLSIEGNKANIGRVNANGELTRILTAYLTPEQNINLANDIITASGRMAIDATAKKISKEAALPKAVENKVTDWDAVKNNDQIVIDYGNGQKPDKYIRHSSDANHVVPWYTDAKTGLIEPTVDVKKWYESTKSTSKAK